jgi:hypothetical protein
MLFSEPNRPGNQPLASEGPLHGVPRLGPTLVLSAVEVHISSVLLKPLRGSSVSVTRTEHSSQTR